MQLVLNGLTTVVSNATPQPIASSTMKVAKLTIQATPGQTGKIYIGGPDLSIYDLTTVSRELWPNPTGGISDRYELVTLIGMNDIDLNLVYIGVFTSGEGPIIEAWKI